MMIHKYISIIIRARNILQLFPNIHVLMCSCVYTIGKPDCSTLKLSSTEKLDTLVDVVLTGTFQFVGEWIKGIDEGSPIYRQVDGDSRSNRANKYYLFYYVEQWFVQYVRYLLFVFNSMKH